MKKQVTKGKDLNKFTCTNIEYNKGMEGYFDMWTRQQFYKKLACSTVRLLMFENVDFY